MNDNEVIYEMCLAIKVWNRGVFIEDVEIIK